MHLYISIHPMIRVKDKINKQAKKLKNLSTRLFNSNSLVLSQSTAYEVIAEYKQTRVRYYASPNRQYKERPMRPKPLIATLTVIAVSPLRPRVRSGRAAFAGRWGALSTPWMVMGFA